MKPDRRWTPDDKERWLRDVDAFLASRHTEARDSRPFERPGYPDDWAMPIPRPGERQVLRMDVIHWLFEVTDGPMAGYRLVFAVRRGTAVVWDLPGYSQRDAHRMCLNFVEGYLPGGHDAAWPEP